MGISLQSTSTKALSTPRPVRAERTCSTVPTEAFPQESIVLLAVEETFSARAGTFAPPRSERTKTMPLPAGAGRSVTWEYFPE